MNKLLLSLCIFITGFANAQYGRFRVDLNKGTISGKKITFSSPIIQTDIKDTSDVFSIGYNEDNERMGVQFHLIKVVTTDGSHYITCMNLVYIERSGIVNYIPPTQPDYDNLLTKANPSFKKSNQVFTSKPGAESKVEIYYNYYVDGKDLDYAEVNTSASKSFAKLQLNIKSLSINDSSVRMKTRIIGLKESSQEQTMEIGSYLSHPVILKYRITRGKMGTVENIVFSSSLFYISENGKEESTLFINGMSATNKYHLIKILDVDDATKITKTILESEYDIIFEKR